MLATLATVIASQALISGAFSLTAQAVQLDYLPRLDIRHTSSRHIGQIYVPLVNWLLMIGCVGLVIGFRSSSSLAAAYGIAVTTTMTITTLLFYRVTVDRWGWSTPRALAVTMPLLAVDMAFLSANVPKIPHGGWLPLLVGVGLVVQMTTWRRGRAIVARIMQRGRRRIDDVVAEAVRDGAARVHGTAVYMFKDPGAAPPAMVSNLRHNHVLHERTVVLSILTADTPRVPPGDRQSVTGAADGVFQVILTFGFLDTPDVVGELRQTRFGGRPLDLDEATFFLGRESVASIPEGEMARWREQLFVVLHRGAAERGPLLPASAAPGLRGRHPGRDLSAAGHHPPVRSDGYHRPRTRENETIDNEEYGMDLLSPARMMVELQKAATRGHRMLLQSPSVLFSRPRHSAGSSSCTRPGAGQGSLARRPCRTRRTATPTW